MTTASRPIEDAFRKRSPSAKHLQETASQSSGGRPPPPFSG